MEGTHIKKPAVGGSIKRKVLNPDLEEERKKCTFDQEEIKKILFIPGLIEFYQKVTQNMKENPGLIPSAEYFEMTREE